MAPTNDMFHVNPIIEELQRIAEVEIKPTLNLVNVQIGDIFTMPTQGVTNLVPGLWIQPMPATTNDFSELPRVMDQKYYFRFVYVRRIALRENITKKSMDDATFIMNVYTDKYQMPDITNLPAGTQVLWTIIKSIEWRPPEDLYVQQIHADITAVAFNMEVVVKTRRAF